MSQSGQRAQRAKHTNTTENEVLSASKSEAINFGTRLSSSPPAPTNPPITEFLSAIPGGGLEPENEPELMFRTMNATNKIDELNKNENSKM